MWHHTAAAQDGGSARKEGLERSPHCSGADVRTEHTLPWSLNTLDLQTQQEYYANTADVQVQNPIAVQPATREKHAACALPAFPSLGAGAALHHPSTTASDLPDLYNVSGDMREMLLCNCLNKNKISFKTCGKYLF